MPIYQGNQEIGAEYVDGYQLGNVYVGEDFIQKTENAYNSATENWLVGLSASGYPMTNRSVINATNDLVIALQTTSSLWDKMYAIYPLVTDEISSANALIQFKLNLKTPTELPSGRYIQSVEGNITGSTNGIQFNNISASYGAFKGVSNVSGSVPQNSAHFSLYFRSNTNNNRYSVSNMPSGVSNGVSKILLAPSFTSGSDTNVVKLALNSNIINVATGISGSGGTYVCYRNDASTINALIRGTKYSGSAPSIAIKSGETINSWGEFTWGAYVTEGILVQSLSDNRQIAFASFGEGLTDQQAQDLSTIINNYQVALGRNI